MRDEIEKILDGLAEIGRGWVIDQLDGTSFIKDALDGIDKEVAEALTSIINLVDKEVIGEDETFVKPTTKRRTYAEISRYSRQALKNEQRAIIRGNDVTVDNYGKNGQITSSYSVAKNKWTKKAGDE